MLCNREMKNVWFWRRKWANVMKQSLNKTFFIIHDISMSLFNNRIVGSYLILKSYLRVRNVSLLFRVEYSSWTNEFVTKKKYIYILKWHSQNCLISHMHQDTYWSHIYSKTLIKININATNLFRGTSKFTLCGKTLITWKS